MSEKYYIGLDIGTDSVGWAVTNEQYEILKFKGKRMWGVRLFNAAQTAEGRRTLRSSRRRLERKKKRLTILRELFSENIYKIDPNFFLRMQDSCLWKEDKNEALQTEYSLFTDENFSDVDYHKEFPTIYHLRKALLENKKEYDVRLVYLALHNILKHRGHFLFEGKNMDGVMAFESVFWEFNDFLLDEMGLQLECSDLSQFEETLKDKKLSKTKKKEKLCKLCMVQKEEPQLKSILGLLAGTTEKLNILFQDEELKTVDKTSICFASSVYDNEKDEYQEILHERCFLLDKIKAIYDWSLLVDILAGGELDGCQYLSVAKVAVYEKHKKDLRILKSVIHTYCPDKYKEVFHLSMDKGNNYCAYVGTCKKNGASLYVKRCNKDDFYRYVGSILSKIHNEDKDVLYLKEERAAGTLLPLQVSGDNGVIPYQVHKIELEKILDNVSTYLPFLLNEDENGLSVRDKIIKTFQFRVPYYVGPLNIAFQEKGSNCWMVRKKEGIIFPWNFKDVVDEDASAELFISRMTNDCTYLIGKKVLPKNSLLYSEFMVLNELNNLKIRDEKLSPVLKKKIINELFKKCKRVTRKRLLSFLNSEGYNLKCDDLTGIDQDFKASLTTYIDFYKIVSDSIKLHSMQEMIEQIIFWMTIYSEGGKILRRKINRVYGEQLTDEQINKICKLKYSGWGKLSKELLTDLEGVNTVTGECYSIIQALRKENDNFMQLLSYKYNFVDLINEENKKHQKNFEKVNYENLVKDLYVSPAVKRSIWQSVQITEEIKKIMKRDPEKIFIEMARGKEEKKESTISRKNQLIDLYKTMGQEGNEWIEKIVSLDEAKFRIQNIFLYFTQMGKDMYTGNLIDLEDVLSSKHSYDRDHIYPQSKTKDDSIINNLVLVNKNDNKRKGDGVVPLDIQKKMTPFWKLLLSKKFITEEKYRRLTRQDALTEEELASFISRQIVEVRQSTKAVATLLGNIYETTEIVYVKAQAVSDFKRDYANEVKVREINDYHHAKDAYLNIVVGNVYNSKFTNDPVRWMKEHKDKAYSLNHMFDFDFNKNDKVIWKRGSDGTIKLVKKMLQITNILYTKYSYCDKGEFFNQQIARAGSGKIPVKASKKLDLNKYGGYTSIKSAYFMLVESEKNGKKMRTIEIVPIYLSKRFESDEEYAVKYCKESLKMCNPRIILPKIKKNAKIILNGFPMLLTGNNGKQIEFQVAAQLLLDKECSQYLKNVMKYIERNKNRIDKKVILKLDDKYGITKDGNAKIYNTLLDKFENSIYNKRPNNCKDVLIQGKDIFSNLTIEEECLVLGEILKLFQCNALIPDLSLIGGKVSGGRLRISTNISDVKSIKLINQSITGLYEKELDLLKI